MSISYSSIVGHGSGKATLPSVDTWQNSMNILRDPPKSIQTKQRNDSILLTSEITQMIQDSGDRVNEAILVYPRGVNPMVDISYDNYGNNGGQRRGNKNAAGLVDGSTNSGKQSYLPYRIMQGGAFRPPARDQRELLPLSRLPRVWTSSYTQPGFADFTKKLRCPSENEKGTKKSSDVLRWSIRPTKTYKLETPIVENYEVKNVIKKILQVPLNSGIQPQKRLNGEIGEPVKQVIMDPVRSDINVNYGASYMKKDAELDHMNTGKYTHDVLYGDNNTNPSQNIQITPIDELYSVNTDKYTHDVLYGDNNTNPSQNIQITPIDEIYAVNTDKYTHDVLYGDNNTNVSQNIQIKPIDEIYSKNTSNTIKDYTSIYYDTPQTSYTKQEYINTDVDLERILPYYESRTNIGHNIHKNFEGEQVTERILTQNRPSVETTTSYKGVNSIDNINREYTLRPTINPGGFDAKPFIPSSERQNSIQEFDIEKSKLRQKIYEMQQGRNVNMIEINPF